MKIIKNSEGILSKNEAQLESFAEYCIKNPDLRFYQALINWQGFNISKVETINNKVTYKDLFYE